LRRSGKLSGLADVKVGIAAFHEAAFRVAIRVRSDFDAIVFGGVVVLTSRAAFAFGFCAILLKRN
jgi:hypothetical protein